MSLLVRTSTDAGALLVRDTDDPLALAVTESTSALALRVRESTSPLAMRVRGLFSPASLPGLAAWYDASDAATVLTTVSPDVPATDGQTVRRWLDKSGNARHLEQAVLANQPTFSAASLAVVGDGVAQQMQSVAFTLAQPITYYCVLQSLAADANRRPFTLGGSGREVITDTLPNTYRHFMGIFPNNLNISRSLVAHQIIGAVLNGASSTAFLNGSQVSADNPGTSGVTQLSVFGRPDVLTGTTAASIKGWLVYAGAHSAADITRVTNWLAARHTITL
jgi:hypothetical protein